MNPQKGRAGNEKPLAGVLLSKMIELSATHRGIERTRPRKNKPKVQSAALALKGSQKTNGGGKPGRVVDLSTKKRERSTPKVAPTKANVSSQQGWEEKLQCKQKRKKFLLSEARFWIRQTSEEKKKNSNKSVQSRLKNQYAWRCQGDQRSSALRRKKETTKKEIDHRNMKRLDRARIGDKESPPRAKR